MSFVHSIADRFEGPCPHCPDGHDDPHIKPWAAWVARHVDRDGQPSHLIAAPTAGAHVAESDAEWLRVLMRSPRLIVLGTCDWGDCEELAIAVRWSNTHGYLPACHDHCYDEVPS